jgi:hypothetical protein
MSKWEYKVIQASFADRWTKKRQAAEVEEFEKRLSRIGQEGWEMISYESVPMYGAFSNNLKGYAYLTFFKRPIE